MNKKAIYGALAAISLLASCTDEIVESNISNGNEISFGATTATMTRAAESFCSQNLPDHFFVWAKAGENQFLNGEKVVATSSAKDKYVFEDGVSRYWPQEGTKLDFIAYRGLVSEEQFNKSLTAPKFENYQIKEAVAEQLDLIYAVKTGAERGNDGKVNLNFRHALSQVVFRAKVTNPSLQVKIKGLEIVNLYDKGTYTLPTETTEKTWVDEDHSDATPDVAPDNNGVGSWAHIGTPTASYALPFEANEVVELASGEMKSLSAAPENHVGSWKKVMTLMPQTRDAWVPGEAATQRGVYIALDCEIYNVANNGNVTPLHTGVTYIPLPVTWKQGIRYIYTINFGNGHAGYTDPENPKPTLRVFDITCTTDDFIHSGSDEITVGDEDYKYSTTVELHNGATVTTLPVYSNENPFNYTVPATYVPADADGQKFVGWATTPGATTAEFPKGTPIALDMTKQSTGLYAVFESTQETIRLSFEGNKGQYNVNIVNMPSAMTLTVNKGASASFTLPSTKPELEGWEFKGWAESANGSKKYDAGASVTISSNTTLYAVWEEKGSIGDYPMTSY